MGAILTFQKPVDNHLKKITYVTYSIFFRSSVDLIVINDNEAPRFALEF